MEVNEEKDNVEDNNKVLTREADQLLKLLTLHTRGRSVSDGSGPSPGPGHTEDNIGLMLADMFRITGSVAIASSNDNSRRASAYNNQNRRHSSEHFGHQNKKRHTSLGGIYHHHM